MTPSPDPLPDKDEMLRMIDDARQNGLSQGPVLSGKPDADDQTNPDQALLDNPQINIADQLGMAAFDLVVRGAITAKYAVQIQNKQFHDDFSMTGGDGTLQQYFEAMFEGSPAEKKKNEDQEALRDAIESAEESQRKRDEAATLSQRELDDMEWEGDSSAIWEFGSQALSRKSWYEKAKIARSKLKETAAENGWSEDQLVHEERLVSDFMKSTKTGDVEGARKAWEGMTAETQQNINLAETKGQNVGRDISVVGAEAASDLKMNASASASTKAGADIFEEASEAGTAAEIASSPIKEAALLNPPDVKLTDEFSLAATDETAVPERQPQLAASAATPKPAAPVLSQEFSV